MNIPEKHRLLFRNTYESLRGRIHSNGYAPTSVTGAYKGMFTRDASIQIMAHTACGDFDAARRMLAYIFSYHRQYGYDFALHIMLEGQPPYSDMIQADSTFFLLHAWYLYAVHAPRSEEKARLLAQTEAQAAVFADYYLTPEFYRQEKKLLRNPNLEGPRENSYFNCYDLLTNVYASQALYELSSYFAETLPEQAARWAHVSHLTPLRFPIGDEIQQEDLPEDTDTAIYVIARQAGESTDRRLEKGDYYLADVEEANIRTLAEHYEKVLLVINCGGILDLSILDEVPGIGAVLHFVQGGEEGGNAFADIVSGRVTPSGKLTDTWAIDYYDYPCAEEFGILGDVLQQNYREGIYVGYRWFDANKIEPRWPFGFGLSYADFEITVQNTQIVGTMVTVTACVRNISSCYSGKDVVQLYLAKPEGKIHKEHKALAAFRKTGLLAPGQEEICTLQVDLQECASYDEETACKLLEQGEYGVFIGSDSRKNALCAVLMLEKTVVTEKLTNILPISKEFELFVPQTKALVYPAEVQHLTIQMGAFAKKGIHYDAPIPVIKTKQTGEYLKTLSDKELIELCVGAGFNRLGYNVTPTTVGRTSINLLKKGIPNVNFSDGPAGLNLCPKNAYTKFGVPNYVDELPQDWQWGWIRKIEPFVLAKPGKGYRVYQYMTCFPAATLQAQTWNPSLIEEVGHAIGTEMIEAGVTLWLAPGLNIHRNPLCGRNFEYYSEDPYVSGVMAASVTRGVQSHPGLGVTIKHFCCNNQEDKREAVSENVPEHALREIYLRGFEIAVRKSKPWAVMTSYNLVNGVHTFASNDLCTKALRNEWEYQGLVMTDWTASEKNPGEHTSCILAGNDLIMPGHPGAKRN